METNGEDHFDIREDATALLTAIDMIDAFPSIDERRRILELAALMLKRMTIAVDKELQK